MTPAIQAWVKAKVDAGVIPRTGRILEIGSRDVNGTVRQFFDQTHYLGVDLEAGPGVDRVGDVREVGLYDEDFDLILCLEVLEHDPHPVQLVEFFQELLVNNNGTLVLSAPTTGFPLHRHPKDYWRFMEDAYREVFFEDMKILALDEVRCPAGFPGLIGAARFE